MSMPPVYLIARRDYLAYVSTLGFWASLLLAPILFAVLIFAPILLARAEPPRFLAVIADQQSDAEMVRGTFADNARSAARGEIVAYLNATAPPLIEPARAAFDAAPNRTEAIAAARALIAARAPSALGAFPNPQPRYLIVAPPTTEIEGLRPYLTGARTLEGGGSLFGVIHVRRVEGRPRVEYWSTNLSHEEPSAIAQQAMRLMMRREALAAQGLDARTADRLDDLSPDVAQFDPRPSAGAGAVTLRERAPFYAAIGLAFVLWMVVFSVANMLLSSVIEERSNKILDTVLTSASPLDLLIGKLLGVACVSLTLFVVWGALGGGLLTMAASRIPDGVFGQMAAAFLEPRLIAAFLIGFFTGYLIYGAIFLALGSLCESIQEAQTLLGPVALVLAVPMMLVGPALDNPDAPVIVAASWFPLFTPFLLLVRAPGGLPWWEIAGMGVVMAIAVVLILRMATRVFHAGVVHQANFASLRQQMKQGGWRAPD